jgi:hypothetical protein
MSRLSRCFGAWSSQRVLLPSKTLTENTFFKESMQTLFERVISIAVCPYQVQAFSLFSPAVPDSQAGRAEQSTP